MKLLEILKKLGIEPNPNQLSTTPTYYLVKELLKRGYAEKDIAKIMFTEDEEFLEYVINELKSGRSLLDVVLKDIKEKENGNQS